MPWDARLTTQGAQMKSRASLACTLLALAGTVGHAEEANGQSGVGYTSVDQALQALRAKPRVSVQVTKPDSWVIVSDPDSNSQWSFTPNGHYADPAVVRRTIKTASNGDVSIEMSALCEATKGNCDRLMKEFEQLNARIRGAVRKQVRP